MLSAAPERIDVAAGSTPGQAVVASSTSDPLQLWDDEPSLKMLGNGHGSRWTSCWQNCLRHWSNGMRHTDLEMMQRRKKAAEWSNPDGGDAWSDSIGTGPLSHTSEVEVWDEFLDGDEPVGHEGEAASLDAPGVPQTAGRKRGPAAPGVSTEGLHPADSSSPVREPIAGGGDLAQRVRQLDADVAPAGSAPNGGGGRAVVD